MLLLGESKRAAIETLISNHYAHSVSSGKSFYFSFEDSIVVYSIPPNKNIAPFLLGRAAQVWELSRLWAPDGHRKNLLTMAISESLKEFLKLNSDVEAVVSYADPNVGHNGGVYRAASWIYTGQVEESRYYVDTSGQVVSRRKFHSGNRHMVKSEILALGYSEIKCPGRHRYVKPITKKARKIIEGKFL